MQPDPRLNGSTTSGKPLEACACINSASDLLLQDLPGFLVDTQKGLLEEGEESALYQRLMEGLTLGLDFCRIVVEETWESRMRGQVEAGVGALLWNARLPRSVRRAFFRLSKRFREHAMERYRWEVSEKRRGGECSTRRGRICVGEGESRKEGQTDKIGRTHLGDLSGS